MNEIWKPIEGYEGKYMISNLGRVKSLNYKRTGKEKILKSNIDNVGYVRISLSKPAQKRKTFWIHRLVAEAFLPNPDNLPQVNHIDENKENNSLENLEWCNNSYNVRYSQTKKVACYKNNKVIKVYNALVDVEHDGHKFKNVSSVCHGKRNTHHGYQWSYID